MITANNYKTQLVEAIDKTSTEIKIVVDAHFNAITKALDDGDYLILVLTEGLNYETVKVIGYNHKGFVVDRDQDANYSFAKGTCVKYDPTDDRTQKQFILDTTGSSSAVKEIISSDGSLSIKNDCGSVDLKVGSDSLGEGLVFDDDGSMAVSLCEFTLQECPGSSTKVVACHDGKNVLLDFGNNFTAQGQSSSGCGSSEGVSYEAGNGITISDRNVISQKATLGSSGETIHLGVTYDHMGNAVAIDSRFNVPRNFLPEGKYCSITVDEDGNFVSGSSECGSGGASYVAGEGISILPDLSGGDDQISHSKSGRINDSSPLEPFRTADSGGLKTVNGHVVSFSAGSFETATPEAINENSLGQGLVDHVETLEQANEIGELRWNKSGHITQAPVTLAGRWTYSDGAYDYKGSPQLSLEPGQDGQAARSNDQRIRVNVNNLDDYVITYSMSLQGDTVTNDQKMFDAELWSVDSDHFIIRAENDRGGSSAGFNVETLSVLLVKV